MSPILLRPVREQLLHDRVIQALLVRLRRRHEVAVNLGADQSTTVKAAGTVVSPDLVLWANKGPRRLEGIAEVETAESVNHLEAMAQWANFGRVRAPFHLYVPAGAADVAQRLCLAHDIRVAEIWTYHAVGDTLRFTLAHRRPPGRSARSRAAGAKRSGTKASARKTKKTTKKSTKRAPAKKASTKKAGRKKAGRTTSSRTGRASGARTVKKAAARRTASGRSTKAATRSSGSAVTAKKRASAGRRPSRSTRTSRPK